MEINSETTFQRPDRLAVLIDADNIQSKKIGEILDEIAKYGTPTVKRIYGDWTSPQLKGWKEELNTYAIIPIQQFSYTTGKNSTDSAMIIDAMDLLYTNRFEGFCLISSDSDFTRLASRIRAQGLKVYGFGEKKTPKAFRAACDIFVLIEVISHSAEEHPQNQTKPKTKKESLPKIMKIIRKAVEATADESGWVLLGRVGTYLLTQSPEFDVRKYGFRKLSDLVLSSDKFEVEDRQTSGLSTHIYYIKNK